MNDLIEFLRAQLDDDERVAKIVGHGGYLPPVWHATVHPDGSADIYAEQRVNNAPADEQSEIDEPFAHVEADRLQHEHIVRWDPARVLALTTALRTIIDSFSWEAQETRAIRILAEALYADRPGYREEWRP